MGVMLPGGGLNGDTHGVRTCDLAFSGRRSSNDKKLLYCVIPCDYNKSPFMSTLSVPIMLSHVNCYQKGLVYRGNCCAMISSSVVQDGEIPLKKSN